MNHSPEPWEADAEFVCDGYGLPLADASCAERPLWEPNRDRIVACVNACAGMADPAAEIERLKRCDHTLMEVLAWYFLASCGSMPADLFDRVQAAIGRSAVIEASLAANADGRPQ